MMPLHCFKQLNGAAHVHICTRARLLDGRTDAGPSREVHDSVEGNLTEQPIEKNCVTDISFDEPHRRVLQSGRDVLAFDRLGVERIEVVDPPDSVPVFQQTVAEVRADESGGSGDQQASRPTGSVSVPRSGHATGSTSA
jgi:hypothetical protein